MYGQDASGNNNPLLTDASGKLLLDTQLTGITLDHETSNILIYGNDGANDKKY